jgi:hypothetical protein
MNAQCIVVSALLFNLTASAAVAQRARGIRSIDFRNFTFEQSHGTSGLIKLRRGRYAESVAHNLFAECRLIRLQYADFDADGREEVLVIIHVVVPGSACYFEDCYVFDYRNGSAHQVFHLSKEQGKGGRIVGRHLVITAPYWTDADAHCCPSFVERVVYRWRNGQFVVAGRKLKRDPIRSL